MSAVLESTRFVVDRSRHVCINLSSLDEITNQLSGMASKNWLEEAPYDVEQLAADEKLHFLLVFDAISFSYWGSPKWRIQYQGREYDGSWGLLLCIAKAREEGKPILNAQYLANISDEEFRSITRGNVDIPLAQQRAQHLREIGQVLEKKYDGKFKNLLQGKDRSACVLVERIAKEFPNFNDVTTYNGEKVCFYKRAQVLIGCIAHFFNDSEELHVEQREQLTACADYKLPQMLRAYGILEYSPSLAAEIDAQKEILKGSVEEVEIRANTIWAVEQLTRAIRNTRQEVNAIDVNDQLWLLSQQKTSKMKPYHLTRTTAY